MKKAIFPLIVLITTITFAQNTQKAINELQNKTQAKVTINNSYGIADFVQLPLNKALEIKGATLQQKVVAFLESNKAIFNIKSIADEFVFEKSKIDEYGLKVLTIKQQYNGVTVYDGKLRFHFDKTDRLTAINGNYIPEIKLDATVNLTTIDAEEKALKIIEDQNLGVSGIKLKIKNNDLFVFNKGLAQDYLEANYLVYKIEVANDVDVREFIFIDAHDGQKVEQFTGIAHAIDRIVYENNTGNIVWQEGDTFPGSLTIWQQNEVVASGHVYNFFKNAFNYVSYDDADAQMKTINNNPSINCPNANWNGTTVNYCDGTASDDVIAHEWGHAYTQHTSGLIYAYESGAINESYSDIWGETIDLLNGYEDAGENNAIRTSASCNSSNRWKVSEDATSFGGAIRDMWDPTCNGDPGKVTDGQYRCGTGDSGGVHTNSGIPNHAYALLVDGGLYNGQTISGLGFTKTAHIFWRAQNQYLTSTSNFLDLANALEASCTDLIGVNLNGLSTGTPAGPSGEILTAADLANVTRAILAVELKIKNNCGYMPLLGEIADLCVASTSNPIYVETWENGLGNWTLEQLPVNSSTWDARDWVIESNLPSGKVGSAIFATAPIIGDCTTDFENGIMRLQSPTINIPPYSTGRFDMAFTHYIATERRWDGGNIKISINGGTWTLIPTSAFLENGYNTSLATNGNDNPMAGESAFTGDDEGSNAGSWGTSVVDLSVIGVGALDTIQLRWEMGTDGCNGNIGWYVDDITIYNCAEAALSTEALDINDIIKVYPNPSNGMFTLSNTNNTKLIKADIYDVTGRFIKTVKLLNNQNTIIDMSNASSGMYFLNVITEKSKGVIKLIKQ